MKQSVTESTWRRVRRLARVPGLAEGSHRLRAAARYRVISQRESTERIPARSIPGGGSCEIPTVLLLVYRKRNARYVRVLLQDVPANADIRLWALDEIDETLAGWTVGTGSGTKFDLLNVLLASSPVPDNAYVLVSDDDVVFKTGGAGDLVRVMSEADIALAQPAHSMLSVWSHAITLAHPGVRASLSHFVEIGPLFAVGPSVRHLILPFDEETGMGWGLNVAWYSRLSKHDARLGIIDCCPMLHCERVGASYDTTAERQRARAYRKEAGVAHLNDLKIRTQTWWRWQDQPRWGPRQG